MSTIKIVGFEGTRKMKKSYISGSFKEYVMNHYLSSVYYIDEKCRRLRGDISRSYRRKLLYKESGYRRCHVINKLGIILFVYYISADSISLG